MTYRGACPSCNAQLSFATSPSPVITCSTCQQRCLVVLPEPAAAASDGEVRIELVAQRARGAAQAGPGKRLVLFGLGVVGAMCALLVALTVLFLLPETEVTRSIAFGAIGGVALLGFALVAVAVAALLVRVLFAASRGKPGFDFGRSIRAVGVGIATLVGSLVLLYGARRLLGLGVQPSGAADWILLSLPELGTGLLAGILVATVARAAPYRHVVATSLTFALSVSLFGLPFAPPLAWVAWAWLVTLLVFAPMLGGAWLRTRLSARASG